MAGAHERDRPRSAALTPDGFRLDIQGIRGFALVLVLACHAKLPFSEGGFVGLDVFYVLSGFLITGLIVNEIDRTGRLSLVRFYARRARRLLPLAVTVLATIVLGSLLLFDSVRTHTVAGDVVAAALYVVNWRFMAESVDYFAFEDPAISPVQHYWSLSVEEQFYLAWPVLILATLALARRMGWSSRALLWLLVAPLGLASFAYGVWFSGVDSHAAYFSTPARAWQIALGCALALALPVGMRIPRWLSSVIAAAALLALVGTAATFRDDIPYPGWYALMPTLAAGAVIVAGTSIHGSRPIRLLSSAPMQYLGRISYAWYLWHWPALVFAAEVLGPMTPLENVLVTLAAWGPAALSHRLIEEPFRRSRRLARRPRGAVAFGLSCTAVAAMLGLAAASMQETVQVAKGAEVQGARTKKKKRLQRSAKAVRPTPRDAKEDNNRAFKDKCHRKNTAVIESPRCEYGNRRSGKVVVNIGDSHALMYFAALHKLANRRDWKLVNFTRAGCTMATGVDFRKRCDDWREHIFERIERLRPDLVVVSQGTDYDYELRIDGRRLDRDDSRPYVQEGLERTFRWLRGMGAEVAVIRDTPRAPKGIVGCVADNLRHLLRCAFRPRRSERAAFDARAARAVPGVKLIDPLPLLCPSRCPAVMGNVLVYRDWYHLSATFSRTMSGWLGRRLPKVR